MYYCPFRHFPHPVTQMGFVRLACLIHAANVRSEPGSNPSKITVKSLGHLAMPSFFNQRSDWSPLLRLALNRRVTTQETRPAQPALKGLAAPNVAPSTHRLVKEKSPAETSDEFEC